MSCFDIQADGLQLMHGDCLDRMAEIPDGSVDLTVTSPPYDGLRAYNGNNSHWGRHVWEAVLTRLYDVTRAGGVVVWVVGDATIEGSETGTSFSQALCAKGCGFNLHDTMVWDKPHPLPSPANRYQNSMEYMFVLSKGRPSSFNPIKDKLNVTFGRKLWGHRRRVDGSKTGMGGGKTVAEFGTRHNVWRIDTARGTGCSHGHPAPFPEQLASDHIISWSNEGDTVLDPFMGSGTTGVACKNLSRQFIGIELDPIYYATAAGRILGA